MRAITALVILTLVTSCSSLKTSSSRKVPAKPTATKNNKIEIIPSDSRDEDKISSPVAIEAREDSETSAPGRSKSFAVFIDSAGNDAFAAIGFLQELERAGLKPVKVMGVGFGCYAALSWASEDNGNKAEWESLKFDSWNLFTRGSVVGRIVSRNPKERFKADFQKNFSKESFSALKLASDCPVVNKAFPFNLRAGASSDLAELVWAQLQLPSLSRDEILNSLPFLSGALAGNVSDREWNDFSRSLTARPDFGGWIYLKTRTTYDVVGDDNWPYASLGRLDRESREHPQRKVGNFKIFSIDMATSQSRNSETLVDPAERRKSLLEGRKRAGALLPRVQSWLREPN